MDAEFDDNARVIDWCDPPNYGAINKFESNYLQSIKQFDEEFEKWFGRDFVDIYSTEYSGDGYDNNDFELPPLLRLPPRPSRKEIIDKKREEERIKKEIQRKKCMELARSLEESKRRMCALMEKRRLRALEIEASQSLGSSQMALSSKQSNVFTPGGTKRLKLCHDSGEVSPIMCIDSSYSQRFEQFENSVPPKAKPSKKSNHNQSINISHVRNSPATSASTPRNKFGSNISKKSMLYNFKGKTSCYSTPQATSSVKDNSADFNNSMDDEEINAFLSQIPEIDLEPESNKPGPSSIQKSVSSIEKKSPITVKSPISSKKTIVTIKDKREKSPIRRCKTFLPITHDLSRSSVKNGENETRFRSSSLSVIDSFWDDGEFTGIDFNAIDAIK
uniref:Inner centromere protein ARK-binding domain-containing protein n=1 Tax=Syphacia muris TaxID=451379 RepID=A0A0N5AWJ2_9BILA